MLKINSNKSIAQVLTGSVLEATMRQKKWGEFMPGIKREVLKGWTGLEQDANHYLK